MPMSPERSASRFPVVLIGSGHDWVARSLESILFPQGMAVGTAFSAREILDRVRSTRTDAVILDATLPDASGFELCHTLRESPFVEAQTPIMLVASAAPTRRKDRIEALKAGAWGYYDLSLDSEELLLRLATYLRAKLAADHVRETSLEDELTGLYSLQGLLRRLREMGSDALRHRRPLACLAIDAGPQPEPAAAPFASVATRFAQLVRHACRASDTIARLPSNEFVVVAPETDIPGAERLAERIASSAESAGTSASPTGQVRIGLFAVSDFKDSAIEPVDLLNGATAALHLSRTSGAARRIVRYTPELLAPS
jgi:two-component system cell cycle response regulator